MKDKIGFIGQGWIGKNYANDFEARGYETVRYALEEPYIHNKSKLKECSMIFIAVPTPTDHKGFNIDYVVSALSVVPAGATAVIKSTMVPGTTKKLQALFPDVYVFHSPEFLVEKTAAYDAANPNRNIVGVPEMNEECIKRAQSVLDVLPAAPFCKVMSSHEAELVKYAGNCFLFTKVIYMNMLYDLVKESGGEWESVREALVHDKRIGDTHTQPVFDDGRGAGGHCFIKDFEAFRQLHKNTVNDDKANAVLKAMVELNIELLTRSNKSLDLLTDTYNFDIKD